MVTPPEGLLPKLGSRREYFDYFDGWVYGTVNALSEGRSARPLVKTYMLETVRDRRDGRTLESRFPRERVQLTAVEPDVRYEVHDQAAGGIVGLVEVLDERHPVLYTQLQAAVSDPWVRRTIDASPWLDRLWLSAPILEQLWEHVKGSTDPGRYTRMSFEHDAFYDRDDLTATDGDEPEEPIVAEPAAEDSRQLDRRSSKSTLVDRVGVISGKLGPLADLYQPFNSLVQLQIPGGDPGGHLLYYDGKITNRSDSFADHRQQALFVTDLYRRVTEAAEDTLWFSSEPVPAEAGGFRIRGAPVFMRFRSPLSPATFERWIGGVFRRRPNRFRLSGYVFPLGPTKAHICAIDHHLWQPLLLEATAHHLLAVLPEGTCGNTIHRLVTNVQRFLDPAVEVWLGDDRYDDAVSRALKSGVAP